MVAPQNLHFTGSLFLSKETIWPLLHIGHVRLKLSIRKNVDITNGFISVTPAKCFVLRTRNVQYAQ